jgi:hypothetical protein
MDCELDDDLDEPKMLKKINDSTRTQVDTSWAKMQGSITKRSMLSGVSRL